MHQRPKCNIVEHCEVGKQQIVLKHHSYRALVRRSMDARPGIRNEASIDRDVTRSEAKQPRQRPQRGGLSGAVWAEQCDYLSSPYLELEGQGEVAAAYAKIGGQLRYHLFTQRSRSRARTATDTPSSSTDSSNAEPGSVSKAR